VRLGPARPIRANAAQPPSCRGAATIARRRYPRAGWGNPTRQWRDSESGCDRRGYCGDASTGEGFHPADVGLVEHADSLRSHTARRSQHGKAQLLTGLMLESRRCEPAEAIFEQRLAAAPVALAAHDHGVELALLEASMSGRTDRCGRRDAIWDRTRSLARAAQPNRGLRHDH
jgi:hypothetical protein